MVGLDDLVSNLGDSVIREIIWVHLLWQGKEEGKMKYFSFLMVWIHAGEGKKKAGQCLRSCAMRKTGSHMNVGPRDKGRGCIMVRCCELTRLTTQSSYIGCSWIYSWTLTQPLSGSRSLAIQCQWFFAEDQGSSNPVSILTSGHFHTSFQLLSCFNVHWPASKCISTFLFGFRV